MARRGGKYGGRRQRTVPERLPRVQGGRKYLMLNLHTIEVLRYEMREVLAASKMAESQRESFIATLMGKGTKMSVPDAIEYVDEVVKRGDIDGESADRVLRILDRHTRRR